MATLYIYNAAVTILLLVVEYLSDLNQLTSSVGYTDADGDGYAYNNYVCGHRLL